MRGGGEGTGRRAALVWYLAVLALVGAFGMAGSLLFLEGAPQRSVLAALACAVSVQVVAFGLLLHFHRKPRNFLGAWVGGSLLRMVGVGVMAAAVILRDDLDPLWALLTVVGLFFVLHMLEPLALRRAGPETGTGSESG